MPPPNTPLKPSSSLPLAYRLTLTLLEPLCALNGAFLALTNPQSYLATVTRPSSSYSVAYSSSTQFLYTQLAGAWLLFAFNQAVVLRLVDDMRVWKLLCGGMLVSDVLWHVSAVQAQGGWGRFTEIGEWGPVDWMVVASAVWPMVVRLGVVLGVGVSGGDENVEEGKKE